MFQITLYFPDSSKRNYTTNHYTISDEGVLSFRHNPGGTGFEEIVTSVPFFIHRAV